jgi:hypothetical protein
VALTKSRFCLIADISEYANENLGFPTTVCCFFFQKNLLIAAKDVYIDHVFVRWQENLKKNHKLK